MFVCNSSIVFGITDKDKRILQDALLDPAIWTKVCDNEDNRYRGCQYDDYYPYKRIFIDTRGGRRGLSKPFVMMNDTHDTVYGVIKPDGSIVGGMGRRKCREFRDILRHFENATSIY